MTRPDYWRDQAPCSFLPPQDADLLFFGGPKGRWFDEPGLLDEARAFCNHCPVWEQCLRDALALPGWLDKHGVRGGLLPQERATLREDQANGHGRAVESATYIGGDLTTRTRRPGKRRRAA